MSEVQHHDIVSINILSFQAVMFGYLKTSSWQQGSCSSAELLLRCKYTCSNFVGALTMWQRGRGTFVFGPVRASSLKCCQMQLNQQFYRVFCCTRLFLTLVFRFAASTCGCGSCTTCHLTSASSGAGSATWDRRRGRRLLPNAGKAPVLSPRSLVHSTVRLLLLRVLHALLPSS